MKPGDGEPTESVLRNSDKFLARLRPLVSRELFFYAGIPISIGLFMGATQAGRTTDWPLSLGISYFVTVCCLNWWAVDMTCRLTSRVLRRWQPPLWITILVGSFLGAFTVVGPINRFLAQTWNGFLPADIQQQALPAISQAVQIDQVIAGLMPWLLANFVMFRFGGMPRYGVAPNKQPESVPEQTNVASTEISQPAVLKKIRPDRQGELLAINAQGHYLRVITTAGEDLILYRFGDVIDEMPQDAGVQVHRSWWVSQIALANSESISPKQIKLDEDLNIPVSRTYQRELETRLSG